MSQSSVWQPYRQRRWRLLWTALAGLAVLGCSLVVAAHRHSAKPAFIGLVVFMGATYLACTALADFPCPKCGKPFSHTDEFRDGFTKVCLHCQHPKWSEPA
jgi:hypothetical protein